MQVHHRGGLAPPVSRVLGPAARLGDGERVCKQHFIHTQSVVRLVRLATKNIACRSTTYVHKASRAKLNGTGRASCYNRED